MSVTINTFVLPFFVLPKNESTKRLTPSNGKQSLLSLLTDLEGSGEETPTGGGKDGHQLLKGHEGCGLVKHHRHVAEVLHIRQVGRIVLGVKPETDQRHDI